MICNRKISVCTCCETKFMKAKILISIHLTKRRTHDEACVERLCFDLA